MYTLTGYGRHLASGGSISSSCPWSEWAQAQAAFCEASRCAWIRQPGNTWTNIGLARSQYVGGIVVDPRDAKNVLVAVLGPRPPGGRGAPETAPDPAAERGVYRSTDGGATWARVLPSDGLSGASDVYMDYRDPQMVFALLSAGAGGPGAHQRPSTGA